MAEDNNRGKELLGRAKVPGNVPPLPGAGGGGKGIKGFFGGVRAVISKVTGRGGKSAGTAVPAAQKKQPLSQLFEAFSFQKLDLKFINRILVAVLAGLMVLTLYVIFRKRPDVTSVRAAVSKINFSEIAPVQSAAFQNVTYYVEQAEARDIFNAFIEKKEEPVAVVQVEPEEPPPPPKVPIEEKAKNLKLIGISWGNDPKAMIKDLKTQEVHFVAEGELIQGTEVSVQEIKKDEVILSSEEDTMSLL
ncbi:MAG: hypothetical protein A3C36_06395 [Omnitrophica WOR_2 bacterium RIFCSPHIGHO2_02_FULL_52_10]|nr:MAG: hypothetical protein A3C36_06395 [Omnitrophica WOR_2 bacterium RIFCSPHIGHO2_02_FULL_52_10]